MFFFLKEMRLVSILKSFCKFNDSRNEKTLYEIKKYFLFVENSFEFVICKLEDDIEKKNFLNQKFDNIRQNLKFIIDKNINNFEKNLRLKNYEKKKEILDDLKNLCKIFFDISFLFKRKKYFYKKYFKVKSKLMENKFDNSFNRTVENPTKKLDKMEKMIKNYNSNLIFFLEEKKTIIFFKFNNILKRINYLSIKKYN